VHKITPADITVRKEGGKTYLDVKNILIEYPEGKKSESGKTMQFAFASSGKTLAIGQHKTGRITVRLEVPMDVPSAPTKKLW
jgi:hypothetical protein